MNSDSKLLVNLLAQCTPGNLTPEVFEAIARVTVYPAVNLYLCAKKMGRLRFYCLSDQRMTSYGRQCYIHPVRF